MPTPTTPRIDITGKRSDRLLADPRREYVVGGPWGAYAANGGLLLAQVEDDVVRQFGARVYDLMGYDSACGSALWMLKAGAMADGLKVAPRIAAKPGEVVSKRKKRTEIKLAAEIYESCERVVSDKSDEVHETLFELADGIKTGCKIAEQVFELAEDGEDRGRLVPTVFQVKPRWAWAFRVDAFLHVERYRCWTVDGWADVDTDHFTRFTWMPCEGDPRGSSIFRNAYTPFNVKLQTYPDYGEYLKKFASASLVLEAGPDAVDKFATDPVTGKQVINTVQQQLLQAGKDYRQHSVLALPPGAKAHLEQSQGNGEAFIKGFDFLDRQIFRVVILSTRPLQEAEHGSKADSESGLDIFAMAVGQVRKALAGCFRRGLLRRYVALNWGDEVAKRFTPDCTFGVSDHVSPELMTAFGIAWDKGLFVEPQKPHIWSKIGVPTPPDWTPAPEPAPAPPPPPAAGGPPPAGGKAPPPGGPGSEAPPEPEPK